MSAWNEVWSESEIRAGRVHCRQKTDRQCKKRTDDENENNSIDRINRLLSEILVIILRMAVGSYYDTAYKCVCRRWCVLLKQYLFVSAFDLPAGSRGIYTNCVWMSLYSIERKIFQHVTRISEKCVQAVLQDAEQELNLEWISFGMLTIRYMSLCYSTTRNAIPYQLAKMRLYAFHPKFVVTHQLSRNWMSNWLVF